MGLIIPSDPRILLVPEDAAVLGARACPAPCPSKQPAFWGLDATPVPLRRTARRWDLAELVAFFATLKQALL